MLLLVLPFASAANASAPAGTPRGLPTGVGASAKTPTVKCADCWAGYGDVSAVNHVSRVRATLVVPTVSCNATTTLSYYGVGIDGLATSNDTASLFVYSYCVAGTLYQDAAIYDSLFSSSITVLTLGIHAGDRLNLSIGAASGHFTFRAADTTTGGVVSRRESALGASLESAVCMTSMGGHPAFAAASFGNVSIQNCSASFGSKFRGIGDLGSLATLERYVCVNATAALTLARPTALTGLKDFTVLFVAAGP